MSVVGGSAAAIEEVKRNMRKAGPRADKVETVAEIQASLEKASGVIFTNYRGLTVSEITSLRRALRPIGGEYRVVKNTLLRRALGGSPPEELSAFLSGPTAVAIALDDPIAISKALLSFLRDLKKPEVAVKGGYIDRRVLDPDGVVALSKAPPKQVLQGQVVGTLQAPLTNFVGTLNGVLSEFARTLQALADQRQAQAQ